jgi:hypothetical protein
MTRTETKATGLTTCPPSLLMRLVITFLAPMFLGVADGNVQFARMAAIETVNDYRARNNADLIAVAQIIAFGLCALGSLSLSLADELSITMALKLRGNANACHRSAEQNRRALRQNPSDGPALEIPPDELWAEADDIAVTDPEPMLTPQAEALLAAESAARLRDPEQPAEATPSPAAPTATARKSQKQQNQELWAIALARQADEITASIPNLPPAERDDAIKRAAVLGDVAHDILYGGNPPSLRPRADTDLPPGWPRPAAGQR